MNLEQYLASTDWSDPYTTDRGAVLAICEAAIQVSPATILELGSHRGLSAAALAIACPWATVTAVDLADEVTPAVRVAHYDLVGAAVVDVRSTSGDYLLTCELFDVIFHDSIHGPAAVPEYALAWQKCRKLLAIHDFEQVDGQRFLEAARPRRHSIHADGRGRQTALLWK